MSRRRREKDQWMTWDTSEARPESDPYYFYLHTIRVIWIQCRSKDSWQVNLVSLWACTGQHYVHYFATSSLLPSRGKRVLSALMLCLPLASSSPPPSSFHFRPAFPFLSLHYFSFLLLSTVFHFYCLFSLFPLPSLNLFFIPHPPNSVMKAQGTQKQACYVWMSSRGYHSMSLLFCTWTEVKGIK